MSDYAHAINQLYGQADLSAKILTALREAGKDLNALTRDDLTSFDEQHDGGQETTRELAHLAGLCAGLHVLDVGSGLGGPARTLAAEFGYQVTGLDLSEAFCQAATMLTARVGLQERVAFRRGSAMDLPFEEATFDAVWTQGVLMNISNKPRFFAEAYRVLRPGGRLAFQASMAGPVPGIYYPALWADDAQLSFLVSPEECRRLLVATGFHERTWQDVTAQAAGRAQIHRTAGVAGASIRALIAPLLQTNLEERFANQRRNYAEGRVVRAMAVLSVLHRPMTKAVPCGDPRSRQAERPSRTKA
jgi:ubiquinone/menaquinone biosynthesis C-methylase UbiE